MNARVSPPSKPSRVMMLDLDGDCFSWAQSVRDLGYRWDVLRVDSSASLIAYLKEAPFQAIVIAPSAKHHLDQDCLIKAKNLQPRAVRVVLPGLMVSPGQVNRTSDLVHRIFTEQQSAQSIAAAIDTQMKLSRLINKPLNREFLSTGGPLPAAPLIYKALSDALNNANSSISQIAEVVQQDPALAAKVLRMVNSAFFGLERQVSNISEAVSMLGLRMLRGLALSGHLASLYPQNPQWAAFSFEKVNQRSLLVARLAMQIAKDMRANSSVQDQAFVAGLLHDIGTLFIASKAPDRYLKVMQLSGEKGASICAVEKKLFGFFHGEIGAYLLAHWGLPAQVVEAVLLHHTPQLCGDDQFTPLTAVHIADALIPPVQNRANAVLANRLVPDYLEQTGAAPQLKKWQVKANSLAHASVR
ncbi:HDOD domain-containing protein [Motiliproteus sediminis]|uniref:HDOD domain-containing protein n=1 Tax=Motiliproteus sediminis TaxID=1468178 RepID=UPI001AF00E0F|nr:HDOD domain-containing protein [Motiliproteus sediminis]